MASVSVTEDTYKEAKGTLGLSKQCNCPERKAWLNRFGAKYSFDGLVDKLAAWKPKRAEAKPKFIDKIISLVEVASCETPAASGRE